MPLLDKLKNKFAKTDKKTKKKVDKKTAIVQSATKTKTDKDKTRQHTKAIIQPHITEKGTHLSGQNKYIFIVSPKANKNQIAAAIKAIYKIKPLKINIIKMQGKTKRFGRIQGRRKDIKKAIITLPPGKKIDIYEGV